jgi:lysozyme family protein
MGTSYSAAFANAWARTGRSEGGYVDDSEDSGGETNHGITKEVAREQGYDGPMRELTPQRAERIAKREYWDVMLLDEIASVSTVIASEMFDTGFNTGPVRAVGFLQRSLNALNRQEKDYDDMLVDGKMGPRTLAALTVFCARRRFGVKVLNRALNGLQLEFYMSLTERRQKDERFLYGWILNRVS